MQRGKLLILPVSLLCVLTHSVSQASLSDLEPFNIFGMGEMDLDDLSAVLEDDPLRLDESLPEDWTNWSIVLSQVASGYERLHSTLFSVDIFA
jgi:hypothetical protein